MTKVGIYVLLRLSLLLFGDGAGPASAHFGSTAMLWGGMATLLAGIVGMLGARDLGKLAGYNVIVSAGSLLGAIGLQHSAVTAGALAYLVVSTLGLAAFFLIAGVLAPPGEEQADDTLQLAPYDPAGGELASDVLFAHEDESRVVTAAPVAVLGLGFFACAVLLAGLPPLAGFVAKFAMLAPMLAVTGLAARILFALVILAGFCTLLAMGRAGIRIFWVDAEPRFAHVRGIEVGAIVALLGLCLALTVAARRPLAFLGDTAQQLHQGNAIERGLPEAQP
jgi:multicomponent K+:H+ antiporter subunit D